MNFEIEAIQHHPENGPMPLHVFLTVYEGKLKNETETELEFDVAAKHLRTFESFRAVVVDKLGWWLDDYIPQRGEHDFADPEDWEFVLKDAFANGRRWQQQQADVLKKIDGVAKGADI